MKQYLLILQMLLGFNDILNDFIQSIKWDNITDYCRNFEGNMSNFSFITVPADGQAPKGNKIQVLYIHGTVYFEMYLKV